MNFAWLGIAFIALAAMNLAYADTVQYPEISADNMIGQDVQVKYQTDNRWTVIVTTQFQVNNVLEIPDKIYYPAMDGQVYTINLKDGFILANSDAQYNSGEDFEIIEPDVTSPIDDKLEELQDIKDEVWGKYLTCMEEFEEEQPIRFEAWKRTAALTDFDIPDDSIAYDTANYQAEELKGERAWQICEAIKKYKWIGVVEANKSMVEDQPWQLDETDSPLTDPVTQDDKDEAERIAESFACSDAGKQQGLCITHFGREEYVPTFSRLPAWYGEYLNQRDTDNDLENAIARSLQTQCEVYYPLYIHKVELESFPEWLEHCVDRQ